jgi:hypothetical protein
VAILLAAIMVYQGSPFVAAPTTLPARMTA